MSAIERLNLAHLLERRDPAPPASAAQQQTEKAFSFKWEKRDAYESPQIRKVSQEWMLKRYCENDPERLAQWLGNEPQIILDAGCGSGYSAALLFGPLLNHHDYLGVDISDAVDVGKQRFKELGYRGEFIQSDLMHVPVPDASVDMIFSEGVLHHTDSTERSLKSLALKLRPGARFLFYVYARKAVIREFTDDHVRNALSSLSDEESWEALKPLTRLGIALGELNVEIEIPEDIPILGIKAGRMDLQRFFYWNICKAYHRPEFSFDEMLLTNFDWFRPLNCSRHTPEEISLYCQEAGLAIEHMDVEEAGITVVARKE